MVYADMLIDSGFVVKLVATTMSVSVAIVGDMAHGKMASWKWCHATHPPIDFTHDSVYIIR